MGVDWGPARGDFPWGSLISHLCDGVLDKPVRGGLVYRSRSCMRRIVVNEGTEWLRTGDVRFAGSSAFLIFSKYCLTRSCVALWCISRESSAEHSWETYKFTDDWVRFGVNTPCLQVDLKQLRLALDLDS